LARIAESQRFANIATKELRCSMEFAVTLKPLACGKVFFSFRGPCCPKSRIGATMPYQISAGVEKIVLDV
jgi:hypothetical protein